MRSLCTLLVLSAAVATAQAPAADPKAWHRLVGILQYLEADYPAAVASQDAFELAEQRGFIAEAVRVARELGPEAKPFVERLERVQAHIQAGEAAQPVSEACGALVQDVVREAGLVQSPRHPPNLERGATLFASQCAVCHGPLGDGQSPLAATQKPPPANFHSDEVMAGLTPYKAFNAVSFGIPNTPMPSFATLDEDDRWSLAFFVFTLRQPPCDGQPPRTTLEALATSTDPELAAAHGEEHLRCLRRKLPQVNEERSLLAARDGVETAAGLAKDGQVDAARRALLDAYLEGLEPVEPLLRARQPERVVALERAFNDVRVKLERGEGDVEAEAKALLTLLDDTRRGAGATSDFWGVFFAAVLILVREGFEATVVLAALLAVLKKVKAPQYAKLVHAGWVAALVAGAVAYALGRQALSGANREWMEGVVALFAVGMLLYAALWLNTRANTRKFMGELRERMQGALTRGSAAGLFVISFTAMFRETFETALFLQGLAADSAAGATYGGLAGLVALLGLVLLIKRVGYVLPMKTLFTASTWVLVGTAVVMLGKGLRALQEVGVLPLRPLPMFEFDLLGIYPDAYTFLPQLALLAVPLGYWLWQRRTLPPPLAPATQDEATQAR